jgi:hypothetical protein
MDHIRFDTASIRYGRPYFLPSTRIAQVALIRSAEPGTLLTDYLLQRIQGLMSALRLTIAAMMQRR